MPGKIVHMVAVRDRLGPQPGLCALAHRISWGKEVAVSVGHSHLLDGNEKVPYRKFRSSSFQAGTRQGRHDAL